MEQLLRLAKNYSTKLHLNMVPQLDNISVDNMIKIYDPSWDATPQTAPYEILTYLLDSYYCLPYRPDLASLFGWQALNHAYNQFLLNDITQIRLTDTEGILHLILAILNQYPKYEPVISGFIDRLPDKVFHYVASYLLKGYALDQHSFNQKYFPNSYKSLLKHVPILKTILDESYGCVYNSLTLPILTGHPITYSKISHNQSRNITHSFAMKLRDLLVNKKSTITLTDGTTKLYLFSDHDVVSFLLFGVLYASRCNNFHGGVASRLNSITANKNTFRMYWAVYLLEYLFLAISLNIQGQLSDAVFAKIEKNKDLI